MHASLPSFRISTVRIGNCTSVTNTGLVWLLIKPPKSQKHRKLWGLRGVQLSPGDYPPEASFQLLPFATLRSQLHARRSLDGVLLVCSNFKHAHREL